MKNEIKAIVSGLATYLGYSGLRETGGGNSALYSYAVWLRHLSITAQFRSEKVPSTVLELGPGRSLGVGLCALLSGSETYIAVDDIPFAQLGNVANLNLSKQLYHFFQDHLSIPNDTEFPGVNPKLDNYDFPFQLLSYTQDTLNARLSRITDQIHGSVGLMNGCFQYHAPFNSTSIQNNAVDFILSQAVLEHVNQIDELYQSCSKWLRPGGIMSHQIDFRSHGKSSEWNGHWCYPDWLWKIIVGKRSLLINRHPLSVHIETIQKHGLKILKVIPCFTFNHLKRSQIATRFKEISESDLITSNATVIAIK